MKAIKLFNGLNFNLTTADDKLIIYKYETDYDKIFVYFFMDRKVYEVESFHFVDNTERTFVPMEERPENIKHSATYGHWQKWNFVVWVELHNAINEQLKELGWV